VAVSASEATALWDSEHSYEWAPKNFAIKNAIFRSSKSANFIKNFATNPEFRQFFVIQK